MKPIELTYLEAERLEKFRKKHMKKCKSVSTLSLTPTGISTHVEVKCQTCKKVKNISDYETW